MLASVLRLQAYAGVPDCTAVRLYRTRHPNDLGMAFLVRPHFCRLHSGLLRKAAIPPPALRRHESLHHYEYAQRPNTPCTYTNSATDCFP